MENGQGILNNIFLSTFTPVLRQRFLYSCTRGPIVSQQSLLRAWRINEPLLLSLFKGCLVEQGEFRSKNQQRDTSGSEVMGEEKPDLLRITSMCRKLHRHPGHLLGHPLDLMVEGDLGQAESSMRILCS